MYIWFMKNIRQIVSELLESGFTQDDLSKEVEVRSGEKCSQPTINRISSGAIKNPRWQYADALKRIHEDSFSDPT